VRARVDRDTMRSDTKEITMSVSVYSNVQQNLAYALSEMGETMKLSADGTTVATTKAVNGAPVLAALTSIAAAETHVIAVHPQIGKVVG
jgi:hypothetical protein